MCRYGYSSYKSHFVCFICRKGFKKTRVEDFFAQREREAEFRDLAKTAAGKLLSEKQQKYGTTYQEMLDEYYAAVSACPDCGRAMCPMGYDFRVPPKKDHEIWSIIQFLAEHNFRFFGCGCYVGYSPPSKVRELEAWLNEHEPQSNAKRLLALFKARGQQGARADALQRATQL
ncbi:MAG: hypothetical protein DWQ01_15700 [Planctomycetota bacterium]|nr:MAG: hypothetical protein DWQ01_15700 [Planctomycetota bacterium]